MYTLIYSSIAAHAMQQYELSQILESARLSNRENDITGCLAYIEGLIREDRHCVFIQVLEGPEHAVLGIYEKIRNDSRHIAVTTIKQGHIANRNFDSWEMGFEKIKLSADSPLQGFFSLHPDILAADGDIKNNILLNFMKSFYQSLDQNQSDYTIGVT
jgi:hypothetical protein